MERSPKKKNPSLNQKTSTDVFGFSEWQLIKSTLDQIHEAAFLIQPISLAILDANQTAIKISGYSLSSLQELSLDKLLLSNDCQTLIKQLQSPPPSISSMQGDTFQLTFTKNTGEKIQFHAHWIPIDSSEHRIFMGRIIPNNQDYLSELKDINHLYQEIITRTKGISYLRFCGKKTYEFFSDNCIDILEVPASQITANYFKTMILERHITDPNYQGDYATYSKEVNAGIRPLFQCDMRIITLSGKEKWIRDTSITIQDPGTGKLVGYLGIIEDITDKKKYVEQLKYEKQLLQSLMDNSPDHLYFQDLNGRFLRINQAYTKHLGINNPDDAIGKTFSDFFTHKLVDQYIQEDHEIITTGQPMINKLQYSTRNDNWYSVTKFPLYDQKRMIIGTVGMIRNITERIHIEMEISKQKNLIEKITDSSPQIIYILDCNTHQIIYINRRVTDILGYSTQEILNMNYTTLVSSFLPPGSPINQSTSSLTTALNFDEDASFRTEIQRPTKDGKSVWLHFSEVIFSKNTDGSIQQILGIAQDISQRKKNEHILESYRELAQLLNNPLTFKDVARHLAQISYKMFHYDAFCLNIFDLSKEEILPIYNLDSPADAMIPEEVGIHGVHKLSPETRELLKKSGKLINRKPEEEPSVETKYGFKDRTSKSLIYIPIKLSPKLYALVSIQSYTPDNFSENDFNLFQSMVSQCGSAMIRTLTTETMMESEEKYRSLIESFPYPVVIIQKDKFQYVNPATIVSYKADSLEEIMSLDIYDLIIEEDREKVAQHFYDRFTQKLPPTDHYLIRMRRLNGVVFPVDFTLRQINYQGHPAWMCIAIDITEQVEAAKAIRQKELYLSALVDIQNILLNFTDMSAAYSKVIELLGKASGTDRAYLFRRYQDSAGKDYFRQTQEWCGNNISVQINNPMLQTIYLDKFDPLHIQAMMSNHCYSTVASRFSEFENIYLSSQEIMSILNIPLFVNQEFVGFLGFDNCHEEHVWTPSEIDFLKAATSAISIFWERNIIQTTLAEREKYYRILTESSTDIITRHLWNGAITYVSPSALTITGYTPEEIVGKKPIDFISVDDRKKVLNYFWHVIHKNNSQPIDFRIRHHDGHYLWLESISKAIVDPETGYVNEIQTSSRDITERIQLENQLRHAERMESIGTLAGGVAHDFNNILTSILGNTELLLKMTKPEPFVKESLQDIYSAADRGSILTKQLLLYSRNSSPQYFECDFHQVMDDIIQQMKRSLGESIHLLIKKDATQTKILGDKIQLQQVILNLATNARDAMPKGGQLEIQTENLVLSKENLVNNEKAHAGNYLKVSFKDTGTGMEHVIREQIFDPFFTTKEVGQGTGLGLPVAYGIIKKHYGWIDVSSELNRGTQFEIYLPLIK